jgi:hypothetical protein
MSDRTRLAREIAARTESRSIDTTISKDLKALARSIAARSETRVVRITRERGGGKVPFTDEQLAATRGGLTGEEYRWKTIHKFGR